jgi:outer membrane protein
MAPTMLQRAGGIAALVCLSLPWMAAQQSPRMLTLAEAQRLAVQNNPHVTSARTMAQAAYKVPTEIRSNRWPSLTGLVTAVGADDTSRLAAGGLNNPVVYSRLASGIALSQLITDFGRTSNLIDSATLQAQAQDQVAETARADVLISVTRAYFALQRARAVQKVAEGTVSARQLVSDQVTTLANSKLKSGLDVSFANVNLADARLLLAQSQNAVKSAEADLASALGLPGQTEFTLAEEPVPAAPPETAEPFIQQALDSRPELKDLRLRQSAAERFTKAEHALFYPTIAAAGTTGVVPAGEPQIPGRYGAAGVNVSIPIFNGGLFRARQTEAELKARAAAQNVDDLANRITRDVRVAYLSAVNAYQRIELTDQLLTQSELAADLARGRYDLGLSSIVELSQAQLNQTAAQIASITARYEYQLQRAVVDYQIGALR